MQIQQIMSRDVTLTDPNTTVREVAETMRLHDVGALPVGENDLLVGMVTDRDIVVRGVAEERSLDTTTVRDVMSKKVYYCYEDDDVSRAAEVMGEHQVRRLPVINREKRLVGVVALADMCRNGDDVARRALAGITQPTAESRH